MLGIGVLQIPALSTFIDQRSHLGHTNDVDIDLQHLHMLQKRYAVHYRLRPHRSRSENLYLYGRGHFPFFKASGSGRTTRTDFGTARWLSDGSIDLSNRRRGRRLGRRHQTGTVCSTALTPCLFFDSPAAAVRARGAARSSGGDSRCCGTRGRPGDARDGSGRPARARRRLRRANSRSAGITCSRVKTGKSKAR